MDRRRMTKSRKINEKFLQLSQVKEANESGRGHKPGEEGKAKILCQSDGTQ
jgi:hypothetical protein